MTRHEAAEETFAILHLCNVPDAVPVLARWFLQEWAPYYGPSGPGDAESDLREAADPAHLPICLVATEGDQPLGTIALKEGSVDSHRHLSPWLAAFLVASEHRRRGVGTALVSAVEQEARRLGFMRIYTATDAAMTLLERRGWRAVDEAPTLRGTVTVYVLDLGHP